MTPARLWEQQKLMRHAEVSSTMNVYGKALMEDDLNQRPLGYERPQKRIFNELRGLIVAVSY
jgi:hypothetical protein